SQEKCSIVHHGRQIAMRGQNCIDLGFGLRIQLHPQIHFDARCARRELVRMVLNKALGERESLSIVVRLRCQTYLEDKDIQTLWVMLERLISLATGVPLVLLLL